MSIIPDDGPRSPEALTVARTAQNGRRGRKGEQIGGGWFVFRRSKRTGRVCIATQFPFEHPTREAALTEARRLADLTPGETYQVFGGFDQITSAPAKLLTLEQART
jgi:hypothetical protein